MKTLKIVALAALVLLTACGQKSKKDSSTEQKKQSVEELSFPSISVPEMLPVEDRAKYLAEHFWDRFDFSDTTYCNKPDITEQAYANYIDILRYVDPSVARAAIADMTHRAEADSVVFDYFNSLNDKYLYDPNSPFRNDELLIPTLEVMIASPLRSREDSSAGVTQYGDEESHRREGK